MKPIHSFSIVCYCFLIMSCGGSKDLAENEDRFKFDFIESKTLAPVLDLAKAENKLVFVDLYADWCLPCKLMEEDVFTHEETADFMNANFINYKVDGEKGEGPDLVMIYEVQAYPTLLFLDHRGRVLTRKMGAAYHRELLELAEEAISLKDLTTR